MRYFDTELEAKSFISYIQSELCSFLFFCGVVGATVTREFYRFIPDPGKFDHIYTDDELYRKYKITDDEKSMIEAIIKPRSE